MILDDLLQCGFYYTPQIPCQCFISFLLSAFERISLAFIYTGKPQCMTQAALLMRNPSPYKKSTHAAYPYSGAQGIGG